MKMINRTSITSTIGVTLMLELTFLPSLRVAIDINPLRSGRGRRFRLPSLTVIAS